MKVLTESGSLYIITETTWQASKIGDVKRDQPLRTQGGNVLKWVTKPEVGKRMEFLTDSITGNPRMVSTSPVMEINHE